MNRTFLTASLSALAQCVLCVAASAAAPPLTVAWRDKAPLHYVENGVEKGVLLERAHRVFDAAGVETRFVREPAKRIWANLKAGKPNYCSFGWYHLPERLAYSQFSAPFHVDAPHTILLSPEAAAGASSHASLAQLLGDARLTLGVVDGVSYGAQIDQLIASSANTVVRRTVEPATMMRMVGAARVSFMFIDRDDLNYFREHSAALRGILQRDYADMPPGLTRYIVCSKDVSPEVMARINKAIDSEFKAAPSDAKPVKGKALP
ncbi:MAG: transporter substrate-binding domain-containing protein [Pseudomonadota bacterium]